MANTINQRTKQLIGRYAKRISMVEKAQGSPLTLEKRAVLANSLHNVSQLVQMKEATNPGSIGQYKRYALDIVTATVPNLIAFDVMSVQSMDNRIGMINYMDYQYSKDKGTTKAGDVFASSINMGPSNHEYSSNRVTDQEIGSAGQTEYGTTAFPIQLNWHPVTLGTFTVEANDGAIIGSADPATGVITGIGVSGKVTVDGRLNLTFTAGTTNPPVINYVFNNEDIRSDGPLNSAFSNVPEVELKLNSLPITATARTMRTYWAFDAQFELQKEYGQDIETLLATQSTGELAHEIDTELTLDLLHFANAGTPQVWSKAMTPGIALVDHYDSFNAKVVEGANVIFGATRKVKANFMVCGLEVAGIIEIMRNFTASGVTAVGPHFLGTLGTLKVYVNPDYPSREYVLGYKGANMFDAGAFYCPYMPISSTDLIMDANFRGQRGWATMYGKKFLNSKMYLRGSITD